MSSPSSGAAPGRQDRSAGAGWDARIFRVLRTRGHLQPLEAILTVFSVTGNYGFFWLGLAAAFWLSGVEDGPGIIVTMPFYLYITLLLNFTVKVTLHRQRPKPDGELLAPLVKVPTSLSFPSSHAAMSFAAAIILTYFQTALWPLFFGLALVMSWSRVYVGVHYPSDVLAGTAVGLATGGALLWLTT